MTKKTCILYWCHGAGHATRIIEVAKELQRKGNDVSVAGGGRGEDFVSLNGFKQSKLSEIKLKNEEGYRKYFELLYRGLPQASMRMVDIWKWIGKEEPEVLITDDLAGAVIGRFRGAEVYRIEHLTPDMLDFPLNWFLKAWDVFFDKIGGEKIFVSTLFKESKQNDELYHFVDPLAQKGSGESGDQDVVLIPGTYGKNYGQIKDRLEETDYNVLLVGGDGWEPRESMIPYIRSADVVVCSGFSSIADSVVSSTPCVVYPEIRGQKAVAEEIDRYNVKGVRTAESSEDAVDKALQFLESDPEKPSFENGFKQVVNSITDAE